MKIRSLPFVLAAFAVPALAPAHFLWASLDPAAKTVAIGLTENPEESAVFLAERIPLVKAWGVPAKPLKLEEDGTWLKAPFKGDVAGVSLNYSVLDKRDQNRGLFWLYYYAKAALTPEASQTKVGIAVELSVVMKDGKPVVTVLHNGKPAEKASVVAVIPGKEETFKGETAADGTITLPEISGSVIVPSAAVSPLKVSSLPGITATTEAFSAGLPL